MNTMNREDQKARLLKLAQLDWNTAADSDEAEKLIEQLYGEAFQAAITENAEVRHGWEIIEQLEDFDTARTILGAFDDEVFIIYENMLNN